MGRTTTRSSHNRIHSIRLVPSETWSTCIIIIIIIQPASGACQKLGMCAKPNLGRKSRNEPVIYIFQRTSIKMSKKVCTSGALKLKKPLGRNGASILVHLRIIFKSVLKVCLIYWATVEGLYF